MFMLVMQSAVLLYVIYDEFYYAECHAKCRYAERHGAIGNPLLIWVG